MHLVEARDYFVCDHCATFHFPREERDGVRRLGEPTGHACPVCGRFLERASVERLPAETCGNCHGLLLRRPAFARVVEARRGAWTGERIVPPAPDPHALERRLGCPACGRTMDTHHYLGPGRVVIDTCPDCALLWLDAGEMTQIERA